MTIAQIRPDLVAQFNEAVHVKANGATRPITLIPFDQIEASTDPECVINGLVPAEGLTVVWGPPKCYKSFWVHDMCMHVALGWDYRGRKIKKGPVVYCAFEGGTGFKKRCIAWRQKFLEGYEESVPFYLQPMRLDLVREGERLIEAIRSQNIAPVIVTLDTLNRSLVGSESKDEDMSAYIAIADRIREEFHCAVVVVHHCGVETTRPRGHTSLGGAADAQHAVKRVGKTSTLTVEYMKDGEEGAVLISKLELVDINSTLDSEPITSCVLVPADDQAVATVVKEPKMAKNEQTMFSILHTAGRLKTSEWYEKCKEVGIGVKRPADLYDYRTKLISKQLVKAVGNDEWGINHGD